MEFVGREEIEEDSTETKRQESERCIAAGQDMLRSTARSTGGEGRSTGVQNMHRVNPVDHPVDRCAQGA